MKKTLLLFTIVLYGCKPDSSMYLNRINKALSTSFVYDEKRMNFYNSQGYKYFQAELYNNNLAGRANSASIGFGQVGFELGSDNFNNPSYFQFALSGQVVGGVGIDFGIVPNWQTNTSLYSLWKQK